MKFQNFSHKTWSDKLGGFGEKVCGSFCTANEARKCTENFAQFFAQTSSRVIKIVAAISLCRDEHSMDQYRSRLELSENFECHWSIRISGEIHMDQSLVHTFSWGNSYGPMVLKVLLKFPPTLVLVHGWLFPALGKVRRNSLCESWVARNSGHRPL